MKVLLAQIEIAQGDLNKNFCKIKQICTQSKNQNIELIVFPELCLTGYLALDLFLDSSFINLQIALIEKLAIDFPKLKILLGAVFKNSQGQLYNSAFFLFKGKVKQIIHKENLPNYDIFFESRYFFSGNQKIQDKIIELNNLRIGVEICEDLWDDNYPTKITKNLLENHVDLVINLSASPFWINKLEQRKTQIFKKNLSQVPFIYLNCIGSGDGYDGRIIFDGSSLVFKESKFQIASSFAESLISFDLEIETKKVNLQNLNFLEATTNYKDTLKTGDLHSKDLVLAITFGIREYFNNSGLKKIIIGLSGGIDSSLVLCLAVLAIGKQNVQPVFMPSEYSSQESRDLSYELSQNLGLELLEVTIDKVYKLTKKTLENNFSKFAKDITSQNLQARIRGNYLMILANELSGLVLATSNRTEAALGYSTLYGDTVGGLAPIMDLNKLEVYELVKFLNQNSKYLFNQNKIIPDKIITRQPTAELATDQTDKKSLGLGYEILSPLVDDLINNSKASFGEVEFIKKLSKKYTLNEKEVSKIRKKILSSEFKRRQYPPGIKLKKKSLGLGRRISDAKAL